MKFANISNKAKAKGLNFAKKFKIKKNLSVTKITETQSKKF